MTMSANKILIADDDKVVHESLGIYLKSEGFEVVDVYDGKAAVAALDSDIALCVLDIMMPEMSGLDVCREIRKTSRVPVIMLTAKGEEIDRILGLELGADDYIVKPFSPREVVARIKAVLRRSGRTNGSDLLTAGPITVDCRMHRAAVAGEEVQLTYKEFALLEFLIKNKGLAFSRDKLLEEVWGYDFEGETRTVDVHIRTLRHKLGQAGELIETVRGVGYRLGG